MENQTESKKTAQTSNQTQKQTPQVITASQRFTNRVVAEYSDQTAQTTVVLTDQQRRLVQGYFVMVDKALATAEAGRIKKNESNRNHDYDNPIPYDWSHINMQGLALDAVHYARMGLDMQEKNHLFPIPYANKKTGLYDISFTVGYSGIQYIAEKYAICPPKSVTIEVVYSNDVFKPYKKSRANPVETYDFDITNPFDRGRIVGGFGYIEYDEPSKNELIIMSLDAIKKRAGKNANPEFWGTEISGKQTQAWENGKKVMVDTDGWSDEMCRKTIVREVYSSRHIPRDPAKIDDDYQHLREREVVYAQEKIESEADDKANATPIDIPQSLPQAPIEQKMPMETAQSKPVEAVPSTSKITDPDF